ncbi:MAG: hypothetical protein ACRDRL_18515 [Sciscionella sp.]
MAADEPAPVKEDNVRVPSAQETAETISKAQRALAEIEARRVVEEEHAAEEARAEQLARWHTDDTHQQAERHNELAAPDLEMAVSDA